MSAKFPITLKYQLPGQIAPSESMGVIDQDQLDRINKVMLGEPEAEQAREYPTPPLVEELQAFLRGLVWALHEADSQAQDNPVPGVGATACAKLSDMRRFGCSPKQLALLLGCNTGYFPEEGEDPMVFFSIKRFSPTTGFYDLLVEGS